MQIVITTLTFLTYAACFLKMYTWYDIDSISFHHKLILFMHYRLKSLKKNSVMGNFYKARKIKPLITDFLDLFYQ